MNLTMKLQLSILILCVCFVYIYVMLIIYNYENTTAIMVKDHALTTDGKWCIHVYSNGHVIMTYLNTNCSTYRLFKGTTEEFFIHSDRYVHKGNNLKFHRKVHCCGIGIYHEKKLIEPIPTSIDKIIEQNQMLSAVCDLQNKPKDYYIPIVTVQLEPPPQ